PAVRQEFPGCASERDVEAAGAGHGDDEADEVAREVVRADEVRGLGARLRDGGGGGDDGGEAEGEGEDGDLHGVTGKGALVRGQDVADRRAGPRRARWTTSWRAGG